MRILTLLVTAILLASCGSGSDITNGGSGQGAGEWGIAASSDVHYSLVGQGATAFIQVIELRSKSFRSLKSLSYSIQPKPGASAAPVHVSYSRQGLQRRNAIKASERIQIPVIGLYAGYVNQVMLEFVFDDDSIELLTAPVVTPTYRNPVLDSPTIFHKRQPGTDLGFNYMVMKSEQGSPVIIDTDGEVRWLGTGIPSGQASTFQDQGFYVGSRTSTQFSRVELDGSITSFTPTRAGYAYFHHNIDHGRNGLLTEVATTTSAASVIAELDKASGFGREWDLGAILSAYMSSRGDDAGAFVRDPADWFHVNAATYRPSDNTLIVSSRENFLIGIDYDTSEIKWILGDPTKYWNQFPSLQDKALVLQGPGDYPIGQHAVSITRDDLILVFNNGQNSSRQPVGAPAGMSRAYSTVSAYRIDPQHRTATEVWGFDYDQGILSGICSSAYETADGSLLIDYAYVARGEYLRMVGLNSAHQLVFDMQFPNITTLTSWNAMPVPLDDIRFD
jgi:hypothetical protein